MEVDQGCVTMSPTGFGVMSLARARTKLPFSQQTVMFWHSINLKFVLQRPAEKLRQYNVASLVELVNNLKRRDKTHLFSRLLASRSHPDDAAEWPDISECEVVLDVAVKALLSSEVEDMTLDASNRVCLRRRRDSSSSSCSRCWCC